MGQGSNRFYLQNGNSTFGSDKKGTCFSKSARDTGEKKADEVPGVGSYDGKHDYVLSNEPRIHFSKAKKEGLGATHGEKNQLNQQVGPGSYFVNSDSQNSRKAQGGFIGSE